MWRDPIVEEVRRIREDQARRFNFDLNAMFDDLCRRQALSGHKLVRRSPRTPGQADVAISAPVVEGSKTGE